MKNKFLLLTFLWCSFSISQAQQAGNSLLDSLRSQLSLTRQDTDKFNTMLELSEVMYNLNMMDSSLAYRYRSLSLAQKMGYVNGELQAILGLEIYWRFIGNKSKAYQEAVRGYHKAINNKLPYYTATFIGEQGIIYRDLNEYSKALKLFIHSKTIYDSINEKGYSAYMNNNIGEIYLKQNRIDSALYYCSKALKTGPDLLPWVEYYSCINMSKIYIEKKDYDQALSFSKKALTQSETGYPSHLAISYLQIARVYFLMNKIDSAMMYIEHSRVVAQRDALYSELFDTYDLLSRVYESNNPQKAFEYQRIATSYKDSLYFFNTASSIETFNDYEDRELQNEIRTAKLAYRNSVRQNILFTGIGICLFIAIIIFRNYKQKQKANKALLKQKEEINFQKEFAENTLKDLQSTQSQLIHSEKMASLGELTAGIAHEIQNPLNFVNNFSEVSEELILELKAEREKLKADRDEKIEMEIIEDIIQNLEKIHHHGKRASEIVKGMLQHSRGSEGKKELTDINMLADEYMRLAFHGMRARDKSFNAEYKLELDESLPKINVVPQDIGRVLLNLINNAFQAGSLKLEAGSKDYIPEVIVSTKKLNDKIEIRVKDNGPGIPEEIRDKIFQPFFTTKPTGQGTGLGLSLSYDIVKAHGGELEVEINEAHLDDPVGRGGGSEFIIILPQSIT